MKNARRYLKFFFFGFILAAILNHIPSCSDEKSPSEPDDQDYQQLTESIELKEFSENLIAAFEVENKEMVIEFLNEESEDIYSEILISSTESLAKYGEALQKRKLIFATEYYAEYEIFIDEKTFTIAYGNEGDGTWELLRF